MKLVVLILILASLLSCGKNQDIAQPTPLSELLGAGSDQGYLRAESIRAFSFPEDHAAHDGYRNEWWYVTGHLEDNTGHEFGYQLTFFRIAMLANDSEDLSGWQTNHVWMAHLALSDIGLGKHYQSQRFSRESLGLAGVSEQPLRIWLENWKIQSMNSTESNDFPWLLQASSDEFSINLVIDPQKPIVLQGDQGLSQKGDLPGNASYYYSITRMSTTGSLTVNDKAFVVKGESWLDREWSTSVLAKDQSGWDWFSLQLNDGRDVMFYRIRKTSGESDHNSAGVIVDRQGESQSLSVEDVILEPLKYWQSDSGASYPVKWLLTIASESKSWLVTARFYEQEMKTVVNYWEGAVTVSEHQTSEIIGRGYLEMTGY